MNHFKIATSQKSLYFDVSLTPRSLELLHLFHKLNLVRTYRRKSPKNIYRVYPTYNLYRNKPRVLKTYFRSSHELHVPLKLLRIINIHRPFSFIVLETNKGILTHKEAIKFNISGRVIMHII